MTETNDKRTSLLRIGCALVVISYLLWIPTFLFAALAVGAEAWFWGRCSACAYALSWAFFIAGLVVAGRDAVRASRRWIGRMFRRQPTLRQEPESDTTDELN